ncbi:MAG: hypothetical protein AAGF12_30410 [Myxococcota bacterium]
MGTQFIATPDGIAINQDLDVPDGIFLGYAELQKELRRITQHSIQAHSSQNDTEEYFRSGPLTVQVFWDDLIELYPIDPWPSVRLEWAVRRDGSKGPVAVISSETFTAERKVGGLGFGSSPPRNSRFAQMIEEWVRYIEVTAPVRTLRGVKRGWLDIPDTRWSPAEEIPEDERKERAMGAFRTAKPTSFIVARRRPTSVFSTLLAWLASSPDQKWRNTPRELALTDEDLLAEFYNDKTYVIPRSALRMRLGQPGEDAVYVFGRGTRLVLTHQEGCELQAALDAQLSSSPSPT